MSTLSALQLASQWRNPSDVSTLLMIIGGDVVRKALAQTTGTLFTPVCFSFGWVAYTFSSIIDIIGDGRLLPPPDYPAKLINLQTGYFRDNKHWVVGRILRDNEAWISRHYPLDSFAIRISVFEAQDTTQDRSAFSYSHIHVAGAAMMILQLVVASIPFILYSEWLVLLITAAGTVFAIIWGSLPQWKVEKLPNRRQSSSTYALTIGNGSRDIMVIKGMGRCLNLEDMCTTDSPRHGRPWEENLLFSAQRKTFPPERVNSTVRNAKEHAGVPYGFWVTRIMCSFQCLFWLALLVMITAVKDNTWYLIIVGGIGMFQNAILAGIERNPRRRNLPLHLLDVIRTRKVMDGLMDLETTHEGCGKFLVKEFFPGDLRPNEDAWWAGEKHAYDTQREQTRGREGLFRRTMAAPAKVDAPQLNRLASYLMTPSRRDENTRKPQAEPTAGPAPQENKAHMGQSRKLSNMPSISEVTT